jgi:hypothetical protein
MLLGNPFPLGGVLTIHDQDVDLILLEIIGDESNGNIESRLTDNITDKEDVESFCHSAMR